MIIIIRIVMIPLLTLLNMEHQQTKKKLLTHIDYCW